MRIAYHIRMCAVALTAGLLCLTFVASAQARWNSWSYCRYWTSPPSSAPSVPPPAATASPQPSAQVYSAHYGSYDNNRMVAPVIAPVIEPTGGDDTYNSGYNRWGSER